MKAYVDCIEPKNRLILCESFTLYCKISDFIMNISQRQDYSERYEFFKNILNFFYCCVSFTMTNVFNPLNPSDAFWRLRYSRVTPFGGLGYCSVNRAITQKPLAL